MRRRLRLEHVHGEDQLLRPGAVADPPAGHAVGLRAAVQRQRPVVELGFDLRRRGEAEAVVDHVLVDVVGQHPDRRVPEQHVADPAHLRLGVGGAGRVGRRVEDHPLGAPGDRPVEVVRIELEAALGRTRHDHRLALAKQHDVRIGDPVGRRDDHLVAGFDRGHQRVVDDLLAAAADRDLLRSVGQAVLAGELGADRLAQRRRAGDGGVLRLSPVDRRLRRLADVLRRIEVRLAGAEPDDVAPGRLQLGRPLGDADGGRGLDATETAREKRHARLPWIRIQAGYDRSALSNRLPPRGVALFAPVEHPHVSSFVVRRNGAALASACRQCYRHLSY